MENSYSVKSPFACSMGTMPCFEPSLPGAKLEVCNACNCDSRIATGLSNPGYEHLEMVYGTFYSLAWPELKDDVSSFLKSEDIREKKIRGEKL